MALLETEKREASSKLIKDLLRGLFPRNQHFINRTPNQIVSTPSDLLDAAVSMEEKLGKLNTTLTGKLVLYQKKKPVKHLLDLVHDYLGFWKWVLKKKNYIKRNRAVPDSAWDAVTGYPLYGKKIIKTVLLDIDEGIVAVTKDFKN
ncbi:hypothetical protein ACFLYT_00505 [Nanoarchaeota archaeon]